MQEKKHLLDNYHSPEDLKNFSLTELEQLAQEIRQNIISTVAHTGGHLSSSLGVVELTIALHKVFNSPVDKMVWDVGHQTYPHKILTGRLNKFDTLRKDDGLCGFMSPMESEHDCFISGHAGTSISAALGMAVGRDKNHQNNHVIAIVGDGAINCGISFEALNNISENNTRLIIILNDNRMSISPNVGALAKYLNRIIAGNCYNKFRTLVKRIVEPIDNNNIIRGQLLKFAELTKSLLVPGIFFEELGLRYIGPIDGHNIKVLIQTLEQVKNFQQPVLIHLYTTKGQGYDPATEAPEKFHGLGQFDQTTGKILETNKPSTSFSSAFGKTMIELAEKHSDIHAITAAMCAGTGLSEFKEKFPDRCFDVGIAETHATIFAAGLTTQKLRPVVAIYATFMQRALDPLFHDICLQDLPVIFCCDRAGIVGDGPTHHGIHDLSFVTNLPNLVVMQPKDENELRDMLFMAYELKHPSYIRYPRGSSGNEFKQAQPPSLLELGKSEILQEGKDLCLYGLGVESLIALKVAEILKEQHKIHCTVINPRFLAPFDQSTLLKISRQMPVASIEDHTIDGGMADIIRRIMADSASPFPFIHAFGWNKSIITHGTCKGIRQKYGMNPEAIAQKLYELLNQ